jgi:hypothetical protein
MTEIETNSFQGSLLLSNRVTRLELLKPLIDCSRLGKDGVTLTIVVFREISGLEGEGDGRPPGSQAVKYPIDKQMRHAIVCKTLQLRHSIAFARKRQMSQAYAVCIDIADQ